MARFFIKKKNKNKNKTTTKHQQQNLKPKQNKTANDWHQFGRGLCLIY